MPANFSRELIVIKVDPDVDSIRENVVSGDLGDSDDVALANPTHFRHDELACCCGDRNANNERVSNQNEVIFMSKRDARRSSAQSDVKEAPYSSVLKAEIDDGDKINKKPKTEEDLEASSDHSKSLPRSSSKELRYHDQHDDQKSQSQPNTGKSQRRSGSMKLSQQLASIVMAYAHMGIISHYSGRTLLGTWGPAFSPDGVIVAISFSFITLGGGILGELGLSVTY